MRDVERGSTASFPVFTVVVGPAASEGAEQMADPTREEYDAKLGTVEARLDARLVGIDGKLDRLFDRVEVSVEQSKEAKAAAEGAKAAASQTKWNILFTAIGALAVLFAAWAIWAQGVEMVGTLLIGSGLRTSSPPSAGGASDSFFV